MFDASCYRRDFSCLPSEVLCSIDNVATNDGFGEGYNLMLPPLPFDLVAIPCVMT